MTGNFRVLFWTAVGKPLLESHAKDCCSIWNSSGPLVPFVQPCAAMPYLEHVAVVVWGHVDRIGLASFQCFCFQEPLDSHTKDCCSL